MPTKYAVLSQQSRFFQAIYRFVKARDELSLVNISRHASLFMIDHKYDITSWLAEEGDYASVNFLIDKFKANPLSAIEGYARGGHVKWVNEILDSGIGLNNAAKAYAQSGHFEEVDQLIKKGASLEDVVLGYAIGGYVNEVNRFTSDNKYINIAVYGYAFGGHIAEVNIMLAQYAKAAEYSALGFSKAGDIDNARQYEAHHKDKMVVGYAYASLYKQMQTIIDAHVRYNCEMYYLGKAIKGAALAGNVNIVNDLLSQGANKNIAVRYYAKGGYIDQVNQLISMGASDDSALKGYLKGNHLQTCEAAMRLAALTDDSHFRYQILRVYLYANPEALKLADKTASNINCLINSYGIFYDEAKMLSMQGVLGWLVNGPSLIKNGTICNTIFFEITSQLMGVSVTEARHLFKIFSSILHDKMTTNNNEQYGGRFFNHAKRTKEQKIIEDRYSNRMTI